jgi:hypothetical protein
MQPEETPRGIFEDTLAIAGRQLLAFVVGAAAGAMYGGMLGWAVAAVAVVMAVVPAGYFKDLWDDRSNHRAIMSGLVQIVLTSALAAVLAWAAIVWMPVVWGDGPAIILLCAYGVLASAAVQALGGITAIACLLLGIGLPDFIDD